MVQKFLSPLLTTALYETSFHLPESCDQNELIALVMQNQEMMPGVLKTSVLIKVGPSPHPDYRHYMVQYLFESNQALYHYNDSKELIEPVRDAFTAKYGDVAKDRSRYMNGLQIH